jgi:pyocin large subunit-like protein
MNNSRLWLGVAVVIVLAVLGASLRHGGPFSPHPAQIPSAALSHSAAAAWSHGPYGSVENAEEHWQKHGAEFPEDRSEQDYVREANAFVHRPPPGTLIKHDARGDTLFYQPSTDSFAVMDARGRPRTFFKPDDRMAYWNRQ